MLIFAGGSVERRRHENGDFSVLSMSVSSEDLELRPTLLYSITGFPLTPKQMTLNDPKWSFYV